MIYSEIRVVNIIKNYKLRNEAICSTGFFVLYKLNLDTLLLIFLVAFKVNVCWQDGTATLCLNKRLIWVLGRALNDDPGNQASRCVLVSSRNMIVDVVFIYLGN